MGFKGGETRVQIPRYLFSVRDSFPGLLNCMVCCVCVSVFTCVRKHVQNRSQPWVLFLRNCPACILLLLQ